MKYVLYVLTLVPLLWMELGIDPYDELLAHTARWMMIWFIILLSLGPLMRMPSRLPHFAWARQPLGISVFTWATLHVIFYFLFHQQPLLLAGLDLLTKPFLVLGLLAFIGMIPLGLTSSMRAIRWLRKRWSVLHKLSLWVAALGSAHGLVAQKVAINEFGFYGLLILILLLWRGVNAFNK